VVYLACVFLCCWEYVISGQVTTVMSYSLAEEKYENISTNSLEPQLHQLRLPTSMLLFLGLSLCLYYAIV